VLNVGTFLTETGSAFLTETGSAFHSLGVAEETHRCYSASADERENLKLTMQISSDYIEKSPASVSQDCVRSLKRFGFSCDIRPSLHLHIPESQHEEFR